MISKILQINKKPLIHSYIHYSNSMGIITNSSIYGHFDLKYKECNSFNCMCKEKFIFNCNAQMEQNEYISLDIGSVKDTKDKFFYQYNKVTGDGEYIIEIKSAKIINIAAEFGILLTETIPDNNESYKNNSYRIFYCGAKKLRSMHNKYGSNYVNNYAETDLPIWIKLKKNGNMLILEMSSNGFSWVFLETQEINFVNKPFYIGIYLDPKTFTYNNWLYSNYIQLHCDRYLGTRGNMSDVELDMFNGFKKRGNYLLNHPFLFAECIEKSDILYLTDIIKFIKRMIDNCKYVQLMLNEKFVPDRPTYDRFDFAHLNLIYGYDDEKEILYLMGYNNEGYYISSEITFNDFYKAVASGIPDEDKVKEDYITCLSFSSPDLKYEINIDLIKTFLQDYLNGYNTYMRYDMINSPPDDRIFGIGVYDCFIKFYDELVYNKRIIHSFLEHKLLMVKRIEYFYKNNLYNEIVFNKLNEAFTSVYTKTDKLRNLLFKELISLKIKKNVLSDKKEKINSLINEIKEEEIIAFNLLISVLC